MRRAYLQGVVKQDGRAYLLTGMADAYELDSPAPAREGHAGSDADGPRAIPSTSVVNDGSIPSGRAESDMLHFVRLFWRFWIGAKPHGRRWKPLRHDPSMRRMLGRIYFGTAE